MPAQVHKKIFFEGFKSTLEDMTLPSLEFSSKLFSWNINIWILFYSEESHNKNEYTKSLSKITF